MADAPSQGPAQVVAQLRALWDRQPPRRRSLAVLVLLAVLGGVVYTTFLKRPAAWSGVADGASPDDTQEILSVLQARGIETRIAAGKVEVKAEKADTARAIIGAAGLPRGGKGFELFDKSSLGQSSFSEQINYRRALQGELARSIIALAQVEGARVHLALGKRSVFKDRDEAASASVALRLHAGQTLSAAQVRGIRQLVAASVDGMHADAVVIVDSHGNLLDGGEGGDRDGKADIERTVTARVRTMLERVVGAGKVSVVATADVDAREVSETQELFDPAAQVVRSEARTVTGVDAATTTGGVAGARGNLPGAPAAAPGAAGAGSQTLQETKNYEVSRTVRQTKKPDVTVQKLHLAVVVDYKTGEDGKAVARTKEELGELEALARQAAGLDAARGDQLELRSIPFAVDADLAAANAPPVPATAALPLVPIAIGAGGALVLLVIVMIVMARRSRARRARASAPQLALPVPLAELERALAKPPTTIEMAEAPTPASLPPGRTARDRVLEAVRGDVERAASVLTGWLATTPPSTPSKETSS